MSANGGGATEIKFLVSAAAGEAVRQWARQNMSPDPHGAGNDRDSYEVTSLYFDTTNFDTFHRRRSFARSKYRIRRYGESQVVFLERKLKRDGVVTKRREIVPIHDIERLGLPNDARPLHIQTVDGNWFSERLALRRLHPVCQIAYSRMARISTTANGPVRLTVDECVRAVRAQDAAFLSAPGMLIAEQCIVEMKFHFAIPAMFRVLVEDLKLIQQPVSKYRLAAAQLGLASENEHVSRSA